MAALTAAAEPRLNKVSLMLGGGVYRTECTYADGAHTVGWELSDGIPYLWSPGNECQGHTLTRYLLAKAGVMSEFN